MNDDPFATVWDETSLTRQRRLLQRVSAVAETCHLALYLDWGTLLGHVREGRILPWDDDVDLALHDPGEDQCAQLGNALKALGLRTWLFRSSEHAWVKVYDPTYAATSDREWTWPFVDIFIYSENGRSWPASPIPRDLAVPGRMTLFEGARCWEPEDPLAVLDMLYPEWRTREETSTWNHRAERAVDPVFSRRIVTDGRGRKVGIVQQHQGGSKTAASYPSL